MRQFVLPRDWDGEAECLVPAKEARHLVRVLRLGPGDSFPALDSAGRRQVCRILSVEGGGLRLAVEPAVEGQPLPDLRGGRAPLSDKATDAAAIDAAPMARRPRAALVLAAALLKGEKFDLVIRQAAEAGVSRIIPLETSRSLGSSGSQRRERQERIINEALQQSGSSVATSLDMAVALEKLPELLGPARGRRLCLVLHETPLVEESLHGYLGQAPDEIVICVGPEGGFSQGEIDFLRARDFRPLHLPSPVLRAETAALFAIAAVETIHSERDTWIPALA